MNIFTLSICFLGTAWIQNSLKDGFLSFLFLLASLVIALAINRTIFPDIEERIKARRLLSLTFLVRVIGIFIFYFTMTYDYGTLFSSGGDDSYYDLRCWQLAQSFPFLKGVYIPFHARGYYYIGSFLYWVFGHNILIPRFLNAFAASLTVIFLYSISKRILDEKKARIAIYLFIFFPDLIWFSSLQLKDTLLIFLIVFSVWLVFQLTENLGLLRKGICVLMLILSIIAMVTIRDTAAYLVFLSFIVSLPLIWGRISNKWGAWVVIIILILGVFIGSRMGTERKDMLQVIVRSRVIDQFSSLESRIHFQERVIDQFGYHTARESLALSIYTGNPFKKVLLLPVGFLVSWILPFPPWKLIVNEEITRNIYFFGSLFWQTILPFFVIGVLQTIKGIRTREIRIETVFLLSLIFVMNISLCTSGLIIGGSARYRLMYIPFIFIFISYGFFYWKRYRQTFPLLAWAIWCGTSMAYLYVKYFQQILPLWIIFLMTILFFYFIWLKLMLSKKLIKKVR